MKKINEIFYSIQGEGCHAGIPSVFIRFSGCNFKCEFCDTIHEKGIYMDDALLIEEIKKYPAEWIILTGGEPALWINYEFIGKLKQETGKKIAIETNGSIPVPDNIDWVTVSPKLGFEGVPDHEIIVKRADELKVVEIGQDLEPYFNLPCVNFKTVMLLQPCYRTDKREYESNVKRTVRRIMDDPKWRLSLQTHRFIGIK